LSQFPQQYMRGLRPLEDPIHMGCGDWQIRSDAALGAAVYHHERAIAELDRRATDVDLVALDRYTGQAAPASKSVIEHPSTCVRQTFLRSQMRFGGQQTESPSGAVI
jgi:hypothetical protein